MNKYLFLTFETPDKETTVSVKSTDNEEEAVIDINGNKVLINMSDIMDALQEIKKFNTEKPSQQEIS